MFIESEAGRSLSEMFLSIESYEVRQTPEILLQIVIEIFLLTIHINQRNIITHNNLHSYYSLEWYNYFIQSTHEKFE